MIVIDRHGSLILRPVAQFCFRFSTDPADPSLRVQWPLIFRRVNAVVGAELFVAGMVARGLANGTVIRNDTITSTDLGI
jgi:hypothetical protein